MKKIAVCIPTLNEEDTIARTTMIIDKGLSSIFDVTQCMIVNSDNNSADNTKEKFLSTNTKCKKVYIFSHGREVGKGVNLINFFHFCKDNNIDYAATIDSDISTIKKGWVGKLLNPIVRGDTDYVTPLYTRSRFEGSSTNHFAFPFIYTFFGKNIRQPIGGEFAFNRSFIEYCLSKPLSSDVRKYGIDIFLTTHALGGNFRVKEVFLGRKLHKPSYPKIVPMFKQIFTSALQTLSSYSFNKTPEQDLSINKKRICIDTNNEFKHKNKVKGLVSLAKKHFVNNRGLYQSYGLTNYPEIEKKVSLNLPISAEDWSEILSDFIVLAKKEKFGDTRVLAELIVPIFLLRTVSFWLEIKNKKPFEVESLLNTQAKFIRSKTWEKLT